MARRHLKLALIASCLVLAAMVSGCGGSQAPRNSVRILIRPFVGTPSVVLPPPCPKTHARFSNCPKLFVLGPDRPSPWDEFLGWLSREVASLR